ncbi:MAG: DUF1569 domain-containing protein, partial [Ferruginibacter sp.]
EIPLGFKATMLTDDLPPLYFPDLVTAIATIKKQLAEFDKYFSDYPDSKPMHPTMGILDKNEWNVFHSKHFNHHFKQFDLV